MSKQHTLRNKVLVLVGLLAVILVIFVMYEIHISRFNDKLRTFTESSKKSSCLSIAPRTGSTDSWIKNVNHEDGMVRYYGVIYDMTLTNYNKCAVSGWEITLQIPEDCYLNNAWCGLVEIHQFINGVEFVQSLDLRNYDADDIELYYLLEGNDLMIPLSKGDYLVYHPNFHDKEYPIKEAIADTTFPVSVGMIFYTDLNHILSFNDYEIRYRLTTKFADSPVALVLVALIGIWVILFFVFGATEISMRQARIRYQQDDKIIHQSIGVFTHFFEAKDIYTNGHSQRVAQYTRIVAERMNMSRDECRKLYYIALLHDCGKCYIPDAVLKKDGKLTDEEYAIIKSHTVKGAEMLHDFTAIDHLCDGVLYHHERYDGRGYPEGLKGENIPLVARIICVCDSFDAMNSRRCYRDRLTPEKIISELKECSGKQFDPDIAKIFLTLIEEKKIALL